MVFFPEFIEDFHKAIVGFGLKPSDVRGEMYVLYNGRVAARVTYEPVEPRALSIMEVFVQSLIRKNTTGSIYRTWV